MAFCLVSLEGDCIVFLLYFIPPSVLVNAVEELLGRPILFKCRESTSTMSAHEVVWEAQIAIVALAMLASTKVMRASWRSYVPLTLTAMRVSPYAPFFSRPLRRFEPGSPGTLQRL